mmetsp:Transcript_27017/g.96488  ORF Transcript_27017/g.96488 Transcript_27017/m.96488 type:complete len:218 (-) Transcript_27017:810-1463(-)
MQHADRSAGVRRGRSKRRGLPGHHQGGARRRRPRHARRAKRRRAGREPRARPVRGAGRIWQRCRVRRALRRLAAARRGADPRRRRFDAPPLRAGLLRAAPIPKGRRGGPVDGPARRVKGGAPRRRRAPHGGRGLLVRRHRRVLGRPEDVEALLHRGEPAHPGGAHGYRGGHGCRHCPGADPHRAGRVARGHWAAEPGGGGPARLRDPVARHDGGPGE